MHWDHGNRKIPSSLLAFIVYIRSKIIQVTDRSLSPTISECLPRSHWSTHWSHIFETILL